DLRNQVAQEGALLGKKDNVRLIRTSGSTGMPVSFFVSQANAFYNEARYFAQFIIEDRDLRLNRCKLRFHISKGYFYEEGNSYAGMFSKLFATGKNAEIGYLGADLEGIIKKLKVYKPHYFVSLPQFLETIISNADPDVFKE